MKIIAFLLLLFCINTNCSAGGDLDKIDAILKKIDEPTQFKSFVEKLGIIEKWNIEADREILLDVEFEWDYVSRFYTFKKYKEIKLFEFCGKAKDRSVENSADFIVSTLTISDESDYYIYRLRNNKYEKTEVGKIEKVVK